MAALAHGGRRDPDQDQHGEHDEGEGDRTRATWLADHEAYFRRELSGLDLPFDPDMPTVFERFDVVYRE